MKKNNISHSKWWEIVIDWGGDLSGKLIDNQAAKQASQAAVEVARAQANAEIAKAELENSKKDNTMLYVGIGGVVLVVLLFIFVVIKK